MSAKRTRFIVVRHGETYWNAERRHQGHQDSALTELGVAQAKALGERLKGVRIDAFVSSDLPRAQHTASELLAFQPASMPVRYLESLRERNLGIFGGLTPAEATERYAGAYAAYRGEDPDFRPEGGESVRDLYERIGSAMNALAAEFNAGQTVVVVTHGGTLEQFLRYVLCIPLDAPRASKFVNTAYNEFSHGGAETKLVLGRPQSDWLLHIWGETSHLGALDAVDDI